MVMPPFILVRFLLPLGWLHLPLFALLTPSGGGGRLVLPFSRFGVSSRPWPGRLATDLTVRQVWLVPFVWVPGWQAPSTPLSPRVGDIALYPTLPDSVRVNYWTSRGGWLFASGTLCKLSLSFFTDPYKVGGDVTLPWVLRSPSVRASHRAHFVFFLTWGGFGSLGYSPLGTGKRLDGEKALQPNSHTASKSVLPVP